MVNRGESLGRSPERGLAYLELILCVAVATLLLGTLFSGLAGNARAVADTLDEAAAGRAAAARLEAIRAERGDLPPGRREFVPDPAAAALLAGARGEEEVRAVRPGLVSVAVELRWRGAGGAERSVRLATLVAREVGR